MFELIVNNIKTGERYPVATFTAQGDLLIAMNALQLAAPAHLKYEHISPKKIEWLFNWIGGGWNSVMAVSKSDAIAAAIAEWGEGRIQISSMRPATPKELKSLLSEFY